jgi:DNA-binding Xre family transcriptional regulator
MVVWNVRTIAKEKGIRTATELAERAGINKNTAVSIWNGSSLRVDRETLAKLCQALQTTPGEILLFEEESDIVTPELVAA